jgi:hypothetical protein
MVLAALLTSFDSVNVQNGLIGFWAKGASAGKSSKGEFVHGSTGIVFMGWHPINSNSASLGNRPGCRPAAMQGPAPMPLSSSSLASM